MAEDTLTLTHDGVTYQDCTADELAGHGVPADVVSAAQAAARVPVSVSSAQAKIQLRRTPGKTAKTLREDVDNAVASADGETQDWYAEARIWERDNPRVNDIGAALKLKPAEIDALFIEAAKIAA